MTLMLCVDEPYASAIFLRGPNGAPLKQWETRPSPPNGEMRPDGVRGLPGASLVRGERIIIASTRKRPRHKTHAGEAVSPWCDRYEFDHLVEWTENVTEGDHSGVYRWAGPVGVILGSVDVINVAPIVAQDGAIPAEGCIVNHGDVALSHFPGWGAKVARDISDQIPWGIWTPGRWAWKLADPVRTDEQCPNDCARFDGRVPGHTMGSNWDWVPCPVCNGKGKCSPIPVRGHQGLQPFRMEALR